MVDAGSKGQYGRERCRKQRLVHAACAWDCNNIVCRLRGDTDTEGHFMSTRHPVIQANRKTLTIPEEGLAFRDSKATAFLALRESPRLTMYVRGLYRTKSKADSSVSASVVCPPYSSRQCRSVHPCYSASLPEPRNVPSLHGSEPDRTPLFVAFFWGRMVYSLKRRPNRARRIASAMWCILEKPIGNAKPRMKVILVEHISINVL